MNLEDVIQRGTRAAQPLATAVATGTIYYVTDELVTERSNGTAWQSISDAGTGYTTEQAQDAVGAMADANSLLYTDATPLLEVKIQQSITKDASGLKLSGDAATPGATKVYGTDGSGVKGWQTPSSGYTDEQAQDAVGAMSDSQSLVYTDATPLLAVKVQQSITKDASGLKLSGDITSPGNNQVYGTDGSGVKGWKADPAGGSSGWTTVWKTADQAKTSNNVRAADSELTIALLANTKYKIRGQIHATAGAGGFWFQITGPASPTLFDGMSWHIDGSGTTFSINHTTSFAGFDFSTATSCVIHFEIIVHNGVNAGNFTLVWAQGTSNAAATTVRAGSYMEYHQL